MTAQPLDQVKATIFTDTLKFLIPANKANGSLRITVQATVGSNGKALASGERRYDSAAVGCERYLDASHRVLQ
jgi:hypothetical protein